MSGGVTSVQAAVVRRVSRPMRALLKSRSGLVIGTGQALSAGDPACADPEAREAASIWTALAERLRAPGDDALAREVVEAMTTNESFFFRDDKPFQHFRAQALPRLLAARPAGAVRCASGPPPRRPARRPIRSR